MLRELVTKNAKFKVSTELNLNHLPLASVASAHRLSAICAGSRLIAPESQAAVHPALLP